MQPQLPLASLFVCQSMNDERSNLLVINTLPRDTHTHRCPAQHCTALPCTAQHCTALPCTALLQVSPPTIVMLTSLHIHALLQARSPLRHLSSTRHCHGHRVPPPPPPPPPPTHTHTHTHCSSKLPIWRSCILIAASIDLVTTCGVRHTCHIVINSVVNTTVVFDLSPGTLQAPGMWLWRHHRPLLDPPSHGTPGRRSPLG
jgi:hypothetical protein